MKNHDQQRVRGKSGRTNQAIRRVASRRHQQGSLAITGAIVLSVAVILLLGAIYLGIAYSQRRQLQAAADMAALSAVQQINSDPGCTGIALSTANAVAQVNGYAATNPAPVVQCGYWQPSAQPGGSFSQTVPAGSQANAVSVTLSAPISYFGGMDTVHATARNLVQDTFSLSSTLATLNGGILNQLLNGLLGGIFGGQKFNLALKLGDYQNLAAVGLNVLDIATAINAGSVNGALNTDVTLAQLIQAEIAAAMKEGVADVNLNVLRAILAKIGVNGGPTLQLGNLLGLSTANGAQAVDASISALSLLTTALETAYVSANGVSIANGTNFLKVPLAIHIPSNPLLTANVSAYIQLIQPPTIASGPPGKNASGQYYTFATSAVGKVFLTVQLKLLGFGGGSALQVDLPIWLFVGPSTAGLAAVNCTAANRSATIDVRPGVLGLYIGGSMSSPPNFNAGTGAVTSGGASAQIIQVLNLIPGLPPLLSVSAGGSNGLSVPLTSQAQTLQFSYPMSSNPSSWTPNSSSSPPYSQTASTNLIASTGNLLQTVLTQLSNPNNLDVSVAGLHLTVVSEIVAAVSPILTGILAPVFVVLNSLVTPLLQLLGLQVGSATVQNFPQAITCSPSLVQ
ncbi:pilus assembly protein TadG-related protein [Burkholderia pseudomultivorans]|uniref:TadG family pilus assembly protein n=1 Tax=Burkholderia pseudomultivorans TaxID=1207504 RepID=UPI002876BB62|nr:TadG family pilus assembly protein [Burkholderia pseudomultivorans]MDS0862516.1 pilus assembly protein TadG-related protein [Burkholderia pseudomultivorans]